MFVPRKKLPGDRVKVQVVKSVRNDVFGPFRKLARSRLSHSKSCVVITIGCDHAELAVKHVTEGS